MNMKYREIFQFILISWCVGDCLIAYRAASLTLIMILSVRDASKQQNESTKFKISDSEVTKVQCFLVYCVQLNWTNIIIEMMTKLLWITMQTLKITDLEVSIPFDWIKWTHFIRTSLLKRLFVLSNSLLSLANAWFWS